MRAGAHRMADGHHRIFLTRGGDSWARACRLLVFVLIWFPSMGEIQIMCDIYMDKVGIPMLVTMSKEWCDICSIIQESIMYN